MNNWPINTSEDGIEVTVTDQSQVIEVAPHGDTPKLMSPDVMVDNPGPFDVFARAGDAHAQATVRSVRTPGASLQPYGKGQTTHIALVCRPGQTQKVVLHIGAGQ